MRRFILRNCTIVHDYVTDVLIPCVSNYFDIIFNLNILYYVEHY
jgi:hypothetical protein